MRLRLIRKDSVLVSRCRRVYYESINRKLKTKYICGCRCYERLQPDTKEFTRLAYTELVLELEHLVDVIRVNVATGSCCSRKY